jgi:hypothetical protein
MAMASAVGTTNKVGALPKVEILMKFFIFQKFFLHVCTISLFWKKIIRNEFFSLLRCIGFVNRKIDFSRNHFRTGKSHFDEA